MVTYLQSVTGTEYKLAMTEAEMILCMVCEQHKDYAFSVLDNYLYFFNPNMNNDWVKSDLLS